MFQPINGTADFRNQLIMTADSIRNETIRFYTHEFRNVVGQIWSDVNAFTNSRAAGPVALVIGSFICLKSGNCALHQRYGSTARKLTGCALIVLGSAALATTVTLGKGSPLLAGVAGIGFGILAISHPW